MLEAMPISEDVNDSLSLRKYIIPKLIIAIVNCPRKEQSARRFERESYCMALF